VVDDRAAMPELHRVLRSDGWAPCPCAIALARESTCEDFTVTAPEDRVRELLHASVILKA